MEKVQHFKYDGDEFEIPSTYHPNEKVWTADVMPYEWDSEHQMRIDLLIIILADGDKHLQWMMSLWECKTEDSLIERYEQYKNK